MQRKESSQSSDSEKTRLRKTEVSFSKKPIKIIPENISSEQSTESVNLEHQIENSSASSLREVKSSRLKKNHSSFRNQIIESSQVPTTEPEQIHYQLRLQDDPTYKLDIQQLETKLRGVILSLLERPVNLMREQHESLELLKEIGRKNQRRLNEIEFAVHKFTRSVTIVDEFQTQVHEIKNHFEIATKDVKSQVASMEIKLMAKLPQMLEATNSQLTMLKDLFASFRNIEKIQFEEVEKKMQNMQTRFQNEQFTTRNKVKELDQIIENREKVAILFQKQIEELTSEIQQSQSQILHKLQDNGITMVELTDKVDLFSNQLKTAEQNRMEKYYTQVAKLDYQFKEMRNQVADLSDISFQSLKFLTVHQPVLQFNQITELMNKCLTGQNLNLFIDVQKKNQEWFIQKQQNSLVLSRDDQIIFGRQLLTRAPGFMPIPEKVVVEEQNLEKQIKHVVEKTLSNLMKKQGSSSHKTDKDSTQGHYLAQLTVTNYMKKNRSGVSSGKHRQEKVEKPVSENVSISMMHQSSNPEETPLNQSSKSSHIKQTGKQSSEQTFTVQSQIDIASESQKIFETVSVPRSPIQIQKEQSDDKLQTAQPIIKGIIKHTTTVISEKMPYQEVDEDEGQSQAQSNTQVEMAKSKDSPKAIGGLERKPTLRRRSSVEEISSPNLLGRKKTQDSLQRQQLVKGATDNPLGRMGTNRPAPHKDDSFNSFSEECSLVSGEEQDEQQDEEESVDLSSDETPSSVVEKQASNKQIQRKLKQEIEKQTQKIAEQVQSQVKSQMEKLSMGLQTQQEMLQDFKLDYRVTKNQIQEIEQKLPSMREQFQQKIIETNQEMQQSVVLVEQTAEKVIIQQRVFKQDINVVIDKMFDDFMLKIEGEMTRRNRFYADTMTDLQFLSKKIQNVEIQQNDLKQNQMIQWEATKQIIESQNIQCALNMQDDKDKEWVSLFGPAEAKTGASGLNNNQQQTANSQYKLSPECITCTGSNQHVLSLFKIACIKYLPNPVQYQNTKYQRTDLIQMQAGLQQRAKSSIQIQDEQNNTVVMQNIAEETMESQMSQCLALDSKLQHFLNKTVGVNLPINTIEIDQTEKLRGSSGNSNRKSVSHPKGSFSVVVMPKANLNIQRADSTAIIQGSSRIPLNTVGNVETKIQRINNHEKMSRMLLLNEDSRRPYSQMSNSNKKEYQNKKIIDDYTSVHLPPIKDNFKHLDSRVHDS